MVREASGGGDDDDSSSQGGRDRLRDRLRDRMVAEEQEDSIEQARQQGRQRDLLDREPTPTDTSPSPAEQRRERTVTGREPQPADPTLSTTEQRRQQGVLDREPVATDQALGGETGTFTDPAARDQALGRPADAVSAPPPDTGGIGEATGRNADQIASLETEFGVNLGEDSVTEFGTLTGRGRQKLAAAQLDKRFPGVDIELGDVELQDDGTGFKLTPGALREVELARASATLGVDLDVSDVVGGQPDLELTEAGQRKVAAGQLDAQVPMDVEASDVTEIEEGFTLSEGFVEANQEPFRNPQADTLLGFGDPDAFREFLGSLGEPVGGPIPGDDVEQAGAGLVDLLGETSPPGSAVEERNLERAFGTAQDAISDVRIPGGGVDRQTRAEAISDRDAAVDTTRQSTVTGSGGGEGPTTTSGDDFTPILEGGLDFEQLVPTEFEAAQAAPSVAGEAFESIEQDRFLEELGEQALFSAPDEVVAAGVLAGLADTESETQQPITTSTETGRTEAQTAPGAGAVDTRAQAQGDRAAPGVFTESGQLDEAAETAGRAAAFPVATAGFVSSVVENFGPEEPPGDVGAGDVDRQTRQEAVAEADPAGEDGGRRDVETIPEVRGETLDEDAPLSEFIRFAVEERDPQPGVFTDTQRARQAGTRREARLLNEAFGGVGEAARETEATATPDVTEIEALGGEDPRAALAAAALAEPTPFGEIALGGALAGAAVVEGGEGVLTGGQRNLRDADEFPAAGGEVAGDARQERLRELPSREPDLAGGGVFGPELDVPKRGDVFRPELEATEEQGLPSELPIQEPVTDRPELLAGVEPGVGRFSPDELEVPTEPPTEQPEIAIPGVELSPQQIGRQQDPDERPPFRRERRGRNRRVPEEFLPGEDVTIGEDAGDEPVGGFGRTVFPGGSQIGQRREFEDPEGRRVVLPPDLSQTVESTLLDEEFDRLEDATTTEVLDDLDGESTLGGVTAGPREREDVLDLLDDATAPDVATDTDQLIEPAITPDVDARAASRTDVRTDVATRPRLDTQTRTRTTQLTDTVTTTTPETGFPDVPGFGTPEEPRFPFSPGVPTTPPESALRDVSGLQSDIDKRRRRGLIEPFEKTFEFDVPAADELDDIESDILGSDGGLL